MLVANCKFYGKETKLINMKIKNVEKIKNVKKFN